METRAGGCSASSQPKHRIVPDYSGRRSTTGEGFTAGNPMALWSAGATRHNPFVLIVLPLAVLITIVIAFRSFSSESSSPSPDPTHTKIDPSMKGIFQFTAKLANGTERQLAHYNDGKPILIANVASRCGYTKGGYEDIKTLREKYGENLHILLFPCNQFLWQEPGSIEQVCEFAKKRGAENADMFDKIDVKGSKAHPLYKYLSNNSPEKGPVKWNFEYFLVSGDSGEVVKRFRTGTRLNTAAVTDEIDKLTARRTEL